MLMNTHLFKVVSNFSIMFIQDDDHNDDVGDDNDDKNFNSTRDTI